MSDKSEKPTDKKIKDARKKGQVAKSAEITSGVQLAVFLGYVGFEGPALWEAMQQLIHVTLNILNENIAFALDQWLFAFRYIILRFIGGIGLFLAGMTVLNFIIQTGPLLAAEAIKPSFKKLNVIANLKNMFSMQSLFEFGKSIFKVCILSAIFYYLLREYSSSIRFLPLMPLESGIDVALRLLFWMIATLLGFYALFGIADFSFQHFNNLKKLKMSKDDIKQEHKNSEGNPEIKSKRKEIHREIQSGSLADNVKKSTAVIRNPTHIAVCIYYQADKTPLPKVLETGYDKRAMHIVQLAEKAGIPVIEDIDLTRALVKKISPGQYISPELFEPVAHILRIAMRLNYVNDDPEN